MPLGGHGDPGGTKLVAPTWWQRPIWPEVRFQHPAVDPAYQRRGLCSSVPASPPSCPPTQTLGSPGLCGRDNQGARSEQCCVLGQQAASRAWAPCILLLPALPCSVAPTVGPGPSTHHCCRSRRHLGTQRPADSLQPWCPCLAGDPPTQLLPGEGPALLCPGGLPPCVDKGNCGPFLGPYPLCGHLCSVPGHQRCVFPRSATCTDPGGTRPCLWL